MKQQVTFNVDERYVHLIEDLARRISGDGEVMTKEVHEKQTRTRRPVVHFDGNGCLAFPNEAVDALGIREDGSFFVKASRRSLHLTPCKETDFNAMIVRKSGNQLRIFSKRFVERVKLKPGKYRIVQGKKGLTIKL